MGNLSTPDSVQKLRKALQTKAKESEGFRFYALYDKVYRSDVLAHAYARCRARHGAAGVDRESFEDIEAYGVERWLEELAHALRNETYMPEPVRRVFIPKPNGTQRPLGIPAIRDRVAQTAVMVVLESIFEPDLAAEQYAYRAERGAHDAVLRVFGLINTGHREVIDADLSSYFDTIPHAELFRCVARRVVDRRVLHLIKMWLTTPVEEIDKRGCRRRTTQNRDERRGVAQGSPISALLANLYMRRFVLGWKHFGYEERFKARIVNYADDLVICCKRDPEAALEKMRQMMRRLKLTVNEEKTCIRRLPAERFDFLGYTFGRCYSEKTGKALLAEWRSKKSVHRLIVNVREQTGRNRVLLDVDTMISRLNAKLRGWAGYFSSGLCNKAYRAVDAYTVYRLTRWLCVKHKIGYSRNRRFTYSRIYGELGLESLGSLPRRYPTVKV